MGRHLNLVLLEGNAGGDPELRYTGNGTAVAQFSLATSRPYKAAGSDEWLEETTWFRIIVWSEQAERIAEKLHKGDFVRVRGRLHQTEWDVDGCPKGKHFGFEIIADHADVLGRFERSEGSGGATGRVDSYVDQLAATRPAGPLGNQVTTPADLDDLPF